MLEDGRVYSVYLSNSAVEIRDENDAYFGVARLVCTQRDYANALEYAQNLAQSKEIPLNNYSHFNTSYEY